MASGEGESDLFRRAMRDVKPLKQRTPRVTSEKATPSRSSGTEQTVTAKRTLRPRPLAPAAPSQNSKVPTLQHGDTTGLDRRTGQRFKRGQMPVEARLDLHGMTQTEAHRALIAFIAGQHSAGRRCVIVVTGKGVGKDGCGVLRKAVPRWLNEAPNREKVLAFEHARQKDGGAGALYVLLKRWRAGSPG